MSEEKIPVEVGEYKGSPVITIFTDSNPPYNKFTFGVNKAKAIFNYLDEIKKFVEDHENKEKEKDKK
ncbi:MAG TPA: hypothetical protein PL041_02005 [Melioribacteraceae bacterium]|nr:hypothetical protein [Melioribacteraceae bacterium]